MKITPRAPVPKEFQDAMKEVYRGRFDMIKSEIEEQPEYAQAAVRAIKAPVVGKLKMLLKNKDKFEFEMTRLRTLSFTDFWIENNSREDVFLCGQTKDIILSRNEKDPSSPKFNFGPYGLCVPLKTFTGENGKTGGYNDNPYTSAHFIPMNSHRALNRHPHHNVAAVTGVKILDWTAATCYGGFNSIIWGAIGDGDIVETFRSLLIYIGRYNPSSPLFSGAGALNYSHSASQWYEDFPWAEEI